jgi:hypothetical protein
LLPERPFTIPAVAKRENSFVVVQNNNEKLAPEPGSTNVTIHEKIYRKIGTCARLADSMLRPHRRHRRSAPTAPGRPPPHAEIDRSLTQPHCPWCEPEGVPAHHGEREREREIFEHSEGEKIKSSTTIVQQKIQNL